MHGPFGTRLDVAKVTSKKEEFYAKLTTPASQVLKCISSISSFARCISTLLQRFCRTSSSTDARNLLPNSIAKLFTSFFLKGLQPGPVALRQKFPAWLR